MNIMQGLELVKAAGRGDTNAIRNLIETGAPINFRGGTEDIGPPLFYAAAAGHLKACQLLIDYGADVNASNIHKWTALHVAAQKNYREITELLLAHNANRRLTNDRGRTPADEAANGAIKELLLGAFTSVSVSKVTALPPINTSAQALTKITPVVDDVSSPLLNNICTAILYYRGSKRPVWEQNGVGISAWLCAVANIIPRFFISVAHLAVEFQYNDANGKMRSFIVNISPMARLNYCGLVLSICSPYEAKSGKRPDWHNQKLNWYHYLLKYFLCFDGQKVIRGLKLEKIKQKLSDLTLSDNVFNNHRYYLPHLSADKQTFFSADCNDPIEVKRLKIGWALCNITRSAKAYHSCTTVINELLKAGGIREQINYPLLYVNTFLRLLVFSALFFASFFGLTLLIDQLIDHTLWNDFLAISYITIPLFVVSLTLFGYLDGLGLDNCCYSSCGQLSPCYRPATLFREVLYANKKGCNPFLECTEDVGGAGVNAPRYYSYPLDIDFTHPGSMKCGEPKAIENREHICSAEV